MSPDLMLELAWKSGLIAAAALAGASLLRARPAAERVAVLRLGVVMLLALPLLAILTPALRVEAPAFFAPALRTVPAAPRAPTAVMATPVPRIEAVSTPAPVAGPGWRIDPVVVVLLLWASGFAVLTLRLLAGVILLHRWTRRAEPVSDPRWLAALARAAQGRKPPVLRASPRVTSPLSWGWRPAIILLDPGALDQAGRADAVLAHEMGHVRHGDWLFLMASRLLVALFWFNPLVWILQRDLARQSEQAADAWAAGRVGRADYASALVAMAARGRPHAALGMAALKGDLARRVIAIMNASTAGGKPWRAALAITACLGFAPPLAAIELSPAAGSSARPLRLQPTAVRFGPGSPVIGAPIRSGEAPPLSAELAARGRKDDETPALIEQRDRFTAAGPIDRGVRMDASGAFRTSDVERDASGAVRTASGFEIDASGAVRTASGVQIDASGTLRADVDVSIALDRHMPVSRSEAVHLREAAREMRRGAAEMDAGAADMERSIAADPSLPYAREGPARILEMRGQAAEMRRQADQIDAQADQAEAPA